MKALPGSGSASVRHAISEDGSRVFWSASAGNALYVRDMARGETVRLDAVQPGAPGTGKAEPIFQGANAAGTVALFTDAQNLTEDAGETGADLYRCEVVVEGGELKCDLSDLTATGSTESAEVQGLLPGMSEDASRAYLVAHGVLDSEPNGFGESAVRGQPNLYAWGEGDGVRFIATLVAEDSNDWGGGSGGFYEVRRLSAAASPSGRYLAFMSRRPLTGYDNRDSASGEPAQEVFRYDAASDALECASCNPSGARPVALRPGSGGPLAKEFDPQHLWDGVAVAALLPEVTVTEIFGVSLYRPRAVNDAGQLFFNAADSLVAADSNGNGDVYQYESLGTGSCGAASGDSGTARVGGGCVSLISSGRAEGTASFLDADEQGNNVFFYTPAPLSVSDTDRATDIYDARVGGSAAVREERAECQGEACQPPGAVPEAPTPASSVFRGPGNVAPSRARRRCPKGRRAVRRHGKTRCLKKRRHHRHRRHHRKHPNGSRHERSSR